MRSRSLLVFCSLLAFGSALAVCLYLKPPETLAAPQPQKPIVVTVHRDQGQVGLELDSNPALGDQIIQGLGELLKRRGRDYPVVGLVDDRGKIEDIDIVPGIAGKVGFQNIRIFLCNRETGKMAEVKLCTSIPITTEPPAATTCENAK